MNVLVGEESAPRVVVVENELEAAVVEIGLEVEVNVSEVVENALEAVVRKPVMGVVAAGVNAPVVAATSILPLVVEVGDASVSTVQNVVSMVSVAVGENRPVEEGVEGSGPVAEVEEIE